MFRKVIVLGAVASLSSSVASREGLIAAVAAVALIMIAATLPCSADQGGSARFIEVNSGLLSVRIEKADLSDVLRTVGEQAGVQVSIQGNLGNVQPQVFRGAPLPEGIERLVQNSNADLVIIYGLDKVGHRYLKEIRAYESNRNNRTSPPATLRMPVPPPLQVPAGYKVNR